MSSAQRSQLLSLPTARREIEEVYTLTPADRDFIFIVTHRTASNRLGVAVQLGFLRHPGRAWTPEEVIPAPMLRFIADQVDASRGVALVTLLVGAIRPTPHRCADVARAGAADAGGQGASQA